ncbi:tyrosine-type recombinase/integrase [Viridibacillus arvi]|uniref:tyrosine-type recombinase/integrase n=1 Tax=Viridibacillus arvi TaxID=263475 RepID=UPI0036B23FA3
MASYQLLKPTKTGKPRIKLMSEFGYDESGKRLRKTKTVTLNKLTQINIIQAIAEFEKSLGLEQPSFYTSKKVSFNDFVEIFMCDYVKVELKVKSRNTYENYLNNGILDFFGLMLLHKIQTSQINLFFITQKKSKSGSIVEKFTFLNMLFNKAVEWGYIEKNPCSKATKPKRISRKTINYYNEEQVKKLLRIIPLLHIKHQLQIKIALFCGLRMGEIAGLRFESIDYSRNAIYVEKTLQYDKDEQRFFLDTTKTGENRFVYAPESLIEELQVYIEEKKKKLSKLGQKFYPIYDISGRPIYLIFSKDSGYPNHPDRMTKQWIDIVKKYDLPYITFHGLRHTFASYMLANNVNIKVIQEQLGHKNIRETLDTYSHIDIRQKEQATQLFNELNQ